MKNHFGLIIKQLLDKVPGSLEEKSSRLEYSRSALLQIMRKKDVSTSILNKVCCTFDASMNIQYSCNDVAIDAWLNKAGDYKNVKTFSAIKKEATEATGDNTVAEIASLKRQIELLEKLVSVYEKNS